MTIYPIRASQDIAEVRDFLEELLCMTAPDVPPVHPDGRAETRQCRSLPTVIVPWSNGANLAKACSGITKDFGTMSVSVLLRQPLESQEAVCGFRLDEAVFLHGNVKHQLQLAREIWHVGMVLDRSLNHRERDQVEPLASWLAPLREYRDMDWDAGWLDQD